MSGPCAPHRWYKTQPQRPLQQIPLFYVIPKEISKLSELSERQSKYMKRFSGNADGHIVICGEITSVAAMGFLREFYHPDHGVQKMKVWGSDRPVFLQQPLRGLLALLSLADGFPDSGGTNARV